MISWPSYLKMAWNILDGIAAELLGIVESGEGAGLSQVAFHPIYKD